jgi:hypothetical protein
MDRSVLNRRITRKLQELGFDVARDTVSVFDGDDDDLHLMVISPRFARLDLQRRGDMVWSLLFNSFQQPEWG